MDKQFQYVLFGKTLFLEKKTRNIYKHMLACTCQGGSRHCVKSDRIRSYSGPHFPEFGLNEGKCGPK